VDGRGRHGTSEQSMKSISEFKKFYIHRAPTDMRKSINGLAGIVEAEMKLDLKSSSLFVFCNKPRTRMKILYFDRSGFALWLKWLDSSKFPWPKNFDEETIVDYGGRSGATSRRR
jgi:transposase